MSLSRLHQEVVKDAVSFPARDKGRGWLKDSEELQHLLSDSSRRPGEEQTSQSWAKITAHKSQKIRGKQGKEYICRGHGEEAEGRS